MARVAEFARIPVLGMAKGPNFCKFGYERQPFARRLKCYAKSLNRARHSVARAAKPRRMRSGGSCASRSAVWGCPMAQTFPVAYLCEYPTLLGGERSLLTFLENRVTARVRPVVVAVPGGALVEALEREGIPWLPWPSGGRAAAVDLAGSLQAREIELVHANSLMTASTALELAGALGVPAVAHVRDIMKLSSAQVKRLSGLRALLAVSNAVAEQLHGQGLPPERITRVYNGVDQQKLQRAARAGWLRQELGSDQHALLVGCIGQIALRKGQDVYLDAAARIAIDFPRAEFLLVGERYSAKAESREYEASLERRSQTPPLRGRTHWLGFRHDIAAILADIDVLVVPSRQEPLSRTLLEGLALGVPSVATRVGGTLEILGDEGVGLLVPPDDPHAIELAVGRLLEDASLRASFREAGPRRVSNLFSPHRQVTAIRSVYELIMPLCRI